MLLRYLGCLLLLLALSACTLTGSDSGSDSTSDSAPAPTVSLTSPLTVAWAAGGDLFTWTSLPEQDTDPAPHRITSGGVIRPFLSPDGAWVAYLRGPGRDESSRAPRSLWISDTLGNPSGANERELVNAADLADGDEPRYLAQVIWAADSRRLYFTTLAGDGIDTRPADDLWQVDASAGTVEQLLPDGAGGMITLSPDGSRLALAAAGDYAQPGEPDSDPGVIAVYDLISGQRTILLEFPAVATGSQRRWYPDLRWLPDGSGLLAAVPPPDLVYGAADEFTALWWLPVVPETGPAVQVGQVAADFFGLPVFSASGDWIAYVAARESPTESAIRLMVASQHGADAVIYAEGDITALKFPVWLPAGDRFVYALDGALWIGGPGLLPERFLAAAGDNARVLDVTWAGANTYLYTAQVNDTFSLGIGWLDGNTPSQTIAAPEVYPVVDVAHVGSSP
ncbi:MAG: hypothetical protein JXQ72_06115 [Anaerolineae bacterium]|nr:hypothetical protein [Anaerolineae bacterium]